ncbi:Hemolysin secretion protein D, chromosomal [Pseudovibrio axinellae]|uniref:Membrane fusion protein (MFP) family protein n=1 Tax=Pseudovibrio axinellae TaxID=989403 RepID=A0A165WXK3_9HYPH|nr:HlyD family type I secretion periplasmic adaptor subunit [Pseudovibrio axinellae]KZL17001.1 Hemolysin secretion protein D, chromosomal [Pseudovibrio axinellae]SER86732.1 HlyD family secretion protein/membrane fusion protein, adhesin transport system [Pseudovibrio axinellae]
MTKEKYEHNFELGDTQVFKWKKRAALVTMVGIALLVIWMIFTPLDEIAKARGTVEPVAQVQRVESRHGGHLVQVDVKLGQTVEAGDRVALLDQTEARSELEAAQARIAGLSLEIERLSALVDKRQPNFGKLGDQYPELVLKEIAALPAQRDLMRSQKDVLEAQIAEKKAEIAAVDAEKPELMAQITVAEEERSIEEALVRRGISSRPRLVELREQAARYRFELAQLAGRRSILEAQVEQLRSQLGGIDLDQAAKARTRIAEATGERRALRAEVKGLKQRLDETVVLTPVAGIVQSLPDETIGDVIDPGGVVITLVPIEGGLQFKGRLSPRDVGFVEVGQPVRLKIDSFDFSRYGALNGVVKEISPTTHMDERGLPFYLVEVGVDHTFFRDPKAGLALQSGMTGEADILTGSKTVFQYIWKPVYTNLDLALSER